MRVHRLKQAGHGDVQVPKFRFQGVGADPSGLRYGVDQGLVFRDSVSLENMQRPPLRNTKWQPLWQSFKGGLTAAG